MRRAVLRTRFLPKDRGSGQVSRYEPGSEARAIDWLESARRGSLRSRSREPALTLTWGAIVDASASMRAGRDRSLCEAAGEAKRFWRECLAGCDRWIDLGCGGRLFDELARATRLLPAHSALLVAGDFYDLPDVPEALLRTAAKRMDCTALVARDPWRDDLPLAGFVALADIETGNVRRFFIGARERARFRSAACAREYALLTTLRAAGWRAAAFSEEDGGHAVLRAFGAA